MGVEVVVSEGFEVVSAPNGAVTEMEKLPLHGKDNGNKVSIQFGSQSDEPVQGGGDYKSDANVPKDAVEEWPAPKQIHSFYFVRQRPFDDPVIKSKLDQADKEIQKCNRARIQIIDHLKGKRAERSELFAELNFLKSERKGFNAVLDEKIKELEPLQQALGKLRDTDGGRRGDVLCSSEKELDDLIRSFHYRIQHESIPLSEEKQLLKQIKQLEGTREKVVANAAMRAKIQDSLGQKEAIKDQVKSMGVNLIEVKRDRQAVAAKINHLSEKVRAAKLEIESLEAELKAVTERREKAYEIIQSLRKQRDEGNANFYRSRTVLTKAKELAANKNIKDLGYLSNIEIEKFMSLWNSDNAFRADYEKRVIPSLDSRQLSRDGRIRNLDEKAVGAPERPVLSMLAKTDNVAKASVKRGKENSRSSSSQENIVVIPKIEKEAVKKVEKEAVKKVENEAVKKVENKAVNSVKVSDKSSSEQSDGLNFENPQYEKPEKDEEIDEEKLKEMKREEELAKARQAMERKRKQQEKAAAKAAIRAQKEAEKKLKEREKKAKKKAAAGSPSDTEETPEAAIEASEAEQVEVEAPAPVKEKSETERTIPRERSFRYRARGRGANPLPKAILKRRKSANYWVWAVPAAAAALMLLVVAYLYVQ